MMFGGLDRSQEQGVPPERTTGFCVQRWRRLATDQHTLPTMGRRSDPVQPPKEQEAGRHLPIEQEQNDREALILRTPVESFVIFDDLPRPEPLRPTSKTNAVASAIFLASSGARNRRRASFWARGKSSPRGVLRISAASRSPHERKVLRVAAEKPASHLDRKNCRPVSRCYQIRKLRSGEIGSGGQVAVQQFTGSEGRTGSPATEL
jgi:hypothetical protein